MKSPVALIVTSKVVCGGAQSSAGGGVRSPSTPGQGTVEVTACEALVVPTSCSPKERLAGVAIGGP